MIFQTSIRTCSILIFRGVRSCYFWGAKHVWIRGIDVMRRPCQGDSYTWQHPTLQHNVGRTSPVEEKHPFSENILYCLYTYLNYYVIHIHVMQKIIVVQKLCRSWTFGVVWTRKDARCPVSKDWCRVSLVKKTLDLRSENSNQECIFVRFMQSK